MLHLFIYLCLTTYQVSTDDFNILVHRKIEHGGFHRYLTTEIITLTRFNSKPSTIPLIQSDKCNLLVIENFDSNFYVDSYELKTKAYERAYSFILSNKVNTESPEYKARPFNLFLYIKRNIIECHDSSEPNFNKLTQIFMINNTTNLKQFCRIFYRLPIHARYQSPVSSGDFVTFRLRPPNLFATNCSNVDTQFSKVVANPNDIKLIVDSTQYPSRLVFPCRKGEVERRIDTFIIQFTNDYLTKTFYEKNEKDVDEASIKAVDMCLWNKLNYKSLNKVGEVKVTIPIGDQNYEILVLILTLLVVTVLALNMTKYILLKGFSYKQLLIHNH